MAGRSKREIRDQDVQGLKCLRKIRPLLSRDEIVDLSLKARHCPRPDHPVRLICMAVNPHAGCRGMRGPTCDGVLRLVTNRLDLPAELIAEIYRLRWVIEMFFRTFKQLLGCGHLC
jgi:IS4 transposase